MQSLDDFSRWSYHLYELERGEDYQWLYLSDRSNLAAQDVNASKAQFNDKRYLVSKIQKGVLPILGTFQDGEYDGENLEGIPIVIKPSSATQGEGVRLLRHGITDEGLEIAKEMSVALGETFIVTPFMQQNAYAEYVWSNSANTLRIHTYYDGEPRIAAAVQKWGSKASGFTDNFSKAGYTTYIHNGVLGDTLEDFSPIDSRPPSCQPAPAHYSKRVPFSIHPDSHMPIRGIVLPFWEETCHLVLSAADALHGELEWAGWDVIITENGPVIIEVNPEPGIQLIQVHTPLLGDMGVKSFLIEHGVPGIEWK